MALSIGELVGYLTFDDSGVNEGANAAEARIRRMGATAENTLDGSAGRIGEAGRRAGTGYGDGLSTGAGAGADRAGNEVEARTAGWKGKVAAAAGTVGGAAGAGFSFAAGAAMDLEQMQAKLQAQLGLTTEESKRIGGVAGSLYANSYGESLAEVGDAVTAVMQNVSGMSDASAAELESVTGQMMSLAQTMEIDFGQATAAVGQMIRNGMATDAVQAMDLLTAGAQNGANRMGDLADVFAEYGETFQIAGLDGATAMGIMSQAMEAGAWSSDLVADAIREFGILAQDSASTAAPAFAALGLDAGQMADDVAAGGDRSVAAMDATLDALRKLPPSAERTGLAVALFGTKAEEMGDSLLAVDPSTAVAGLGNVAGASADADTALSSLSSNAITNLQREAELLGAKLVTTEGPLGTLAAGAAAFGPTALSMAGSMGMVVLAIGPLIGRLGALALSAATTAGRFALSMLGMAANAALAVGRILISLALWVAQTLAQGAIAVASMVATAARYVAAWVLMGVQAMARAVMMAAAWLVAMGPIGWVIAAVIGLVALIIANWDTVVAWTTQAWSAVTQFISDAWNNIVNAVRNGANNVLNFVRGLPGQILGALGNLGSLLFNAGRDIVTGLWNGIVGMGRWLYSKIMGWIKSVVPGPILSFLGIASPSKFMKNEVGKWIPEGLADGILGNAKVAGDAARELAAGVAADAQKGVASSAQVAVELGSITDQQWDQLRGMGFKGRAGDSREALYVPQNILDQVKGGGGKTVSVTINNPQPERASDAIGRAGSVLAALGPWGDDD